MSNEWADVGAEADLKKSPLQEVRIGRAKIALTFHEGKWGAISGVCNHVGGPLGNGTLEGDYVTCPWHYWKFHYRTGEGEPGYEADKVPMHEVKVENGRVLVRAEASTKRHKTPHAPHPLGRPYERAPGPIRVVGISTTADTVGHPRYSTSDALLRDAVEAAKAAGCETQFIRLEDLKFRTCEGFFSKSFKACTWPCSITQMDEKDELTVVYDSLVHWGDVILIATPIRWGNPSSLYIKMVERMNCLNDTQNGKLIIQNKVAGFIITGGQDNIQAVAGQMLGFFAELGFLFPTLPYIAHSRGWSAEDMENNIAYVKTHEELHEGARDLARRAVEFAKVVLDHHETKDRIAVRGGRKGVAIDHEKDETPA